MFNVLNVISHLLMLKYFGLRIDRVLVSKERCMGDPTFEERWSVQLKRIPKRVLPWERHKLKDIPQNPSDEQVVAYIESAKPLMERGRWWYASTGRLMSAGQFLAVFVFAYLVLGGAEYFTWMTFGSGFKRLIPRIVMVVFMLAASLLVADYVTRRLRR